MPAPPRTLFEKIWEPHVVQRQAGAPDVLYIDLHLIHEVTSPQAFSGLRQRGLAVRRPDRTLATMDHSTPTLPGVSADAQGAAQLEALRQNTAAAGIRLYDQLEAENGIVHVLGPELGRTQPGMTIVCGDSHTSTHGAFGAIAFGIGTSEVEHVLATQTVLQNKPLNCEVRIDGRLQHGVTPKDVILKLIADIGVEGGSGYAIEYCGSTISAMDMAGRMTICNMTIEAGARFGLIAPDDTTYQYLSGRPHVPQGSDWMAALARWQQLPSDAEAVFDRRLVLDAARLEPMITYGTNPGMGIAISAAVPDPAAIADLNRRQALTRALEYMQLAPGRPLLGQPVEVVFIGSCTNSRLEDLQAAAAVFRSRKVARGLRVLVVPGSWEVRREAERLGLDQVFLEAGAEWRIPGCSMCLAMNGDQLEAGQLAVSTSNRNFEGRQGSGGRTLLASPLTAAAAAVTGVISDVRTLL